MITGAEIVTVTKVGANVTRGVRDALAEPRSGWPRSHEALMELWVIMRDWSLMARETNIAFNDAIKFRQDPNWQNLDFTFPDRIQQLKSAHTVSRDAELLLTPTVPWTVRWRASKRRAAARQSLRNLMQLYCPELLQSFESAVAERANWIKDNRKDFKERLLDPVISLDDLRADVEVLESTRQSLESVCESLRQLINDRFPLGDAGSGG